MLENGKLCWLWMIDIFIALYVCNVLTCHFLSFYAIFASKFRPILTKDFHCLNSDNLRKRNLSFEGLFWVNKNNFNLTPPVVIEKPPYKKNQIVSRWGLKILGGFI